MTHFLELSTTSGNKNLLFVNSEIAKIFYKLEVTGETRRSFGFLATLTIDNSTVD